LLKIQSESKSIKDTGLANAEAEAQAQANNLKAEAKVITSSLEAQAKKISAESNDTLEKAMYDVKISHEKR